MLIKLFYLYSKAEVWKIAEAEVLNTHESKLGQDEASEYSANSWTAWAERMKSEAMEANKQIGNRDNACYLPRLANPLLHDVKLFLLWGNALRRRFG